MRISGIRVKNFRLLRDVQLALDPQSTVVVGRNNSGKTSLTELFRRMLTETTPHFPLEDFSLSTHEDFWNAFVLFKQGREHGEIRGALPTIDVELSINYSDSSGDFGPLSEFIIDLQEDTVEALLRIRYQLDLGKIDSLFAGFDPGAVGEVDERAEYFRSLKERVPRLYKCSLDAIDPTDPSNTRSIEWKRLQDLVQGDFINAQRRLDEPANQDAISKILESLFSTASSEYAASGDKDAAEQLAKAISNMEESVQENIKTNLRILLPTMSLFGYPGLVDPGLSTETKLDASSLLSNYTRVRYEGANGISLPESYNGLGTRNLIYILLKLLQFFKSYHAMQRSAGMQIVFIEEPEAHLHPQMQEVFIRQLSEIAAIFARDYNQGIAWPVQFVVSTHSPHMANEAPFEATRYFVASIDEGNGAFFQTRVKDLSKGLGGVASRDKEFLHKYLTLTRCDLLFADKAVLIEGTSERLLLPRMMKSISSGTAIDRPLSSQYVAVIEIGGAYAHKFYALLDFLELQTLIITDLDSVKGSKRSACLVSEGENTSNECLKEWFANPNITPAELIAKSADDKVRNSRRVAYQIPQTNDEPCARSFEGSFMLANKALFGLDADSEEDLEAAVWALAKEVNKTQFAFQHAIDEEDWQIPRYIEEGLRWLSSDATGTPIHGEIEIPTALLDGNN